MKRIHFTDPYLLNPTHQVTVDLIGVGGTGSQVLSALGRIDCALRSLGHPGLHVTAYDPDEVTEANIGRQLFSESDIGLNKANVLTTRINRFFGNGWESISERYSKRVEPANVTISCVDSVLSRMEIDEAIYPSNGIDHNRRIYWIDFGNTTNRGQVVIGTLCDVKQPKVDEFETVPVLKKVTEIFDLRSVDEKDSGPSCSLAEALQKQDLFINSTLSQLGCSLIWKMLSAGSIDCNGLFLNLETMKTNPIKL